MDFQQRLSRDERVEIVTRLVLELLRGFRFVCLQARFLHVRLGQLTHKSRNLRSATEKKGITEPFTPISCEIV